MYPFFYDIRSEIKIIKHSEIFNKDYEIENVVHIVNTKQAGLYIKHNVPLVDLFWSKDTLCFVFDKELSRHAYDLWCRHELN